MSNLTICSAYGMWPQFNQRLRDVLAAITDDQLDISQPLFGRPKVTGATRRFR